MISPGFLSRAERRELEVCVRSQREDHGVARRANAILLLDDGKSCQAIVEFLYLDGPPGQRRHLCLPGPELHRDPNFVILREAIAAKHYDGLQAATALLFLPSFAAGPITGTRPFDRNAWPAAPTWSYTLTGASRIGWGAAMFLVFRKFAAGYDLSPMGAFEPLADMYRDFVVLYFDFAGYTSVAIGWALLFGLRLP